MKCNSRADGRPALRVNEVWRTSSWRSESDLKQLPGAADETAQREREEEGMGGDSE